MKAAIPLLSALLALTASSAAWAGATIHDGVIMSRGSTLYDYAPSTIIGDGPYAKMWFCSSAAGDRIFYAENRNGIWVLQNGGNPVFSPDTTRNPDGSARWDSVHACDPSVVKGDFYAPDGSRFAYAMYYSGADNGPGINTRIGVAFSNDGIVWVRKLAGPVISPSGACTLPQSYGAGQQSAYRYGSSGRNIKLVYWEKTDANPYYGTIRSVESGDGISFGPPSVLRTVTQQTNQGFSEVIGDVAYEPSPVDKWWITTKAESDQVVYVYQTSGSALTTTWNLKGKLDVTSTGKASNNNSGWIRKQNGDIHVESGTAYRYLQYAVGGSDPNTWDIAQGRYVDGWGFDVNGHREGWTAVNVTGDNGPSGGVWPVTACCSDPQFVSPPLTLDADTNKTLQVQVANQNANTKLKVYFATSTENYFSEDKSLSISIANDGAWRTYSLYLHLNNSKYRGRITRLRVDPVETGSNRPVGIGDIRLLPY